MAKKLSIDEQLAAFAWLQAIGTNIAALGQTKALSKSKKQQEEANKLSILGNAMQSIANAAQAELTAAQRSAASDKEANDLTVAGNVLQSVGNALQVIAGLNDLPTSQRSGRSVSRRVHPPKRKS
ncbi:DUF6944 family repetitive protein [Paenibacillus tengchongensis]|uniref:DUF6944 family repetitive protein n=1 Tax=Paenibacillus tengchongensis TaxID=2608684 RepID=UPI001FE9A24E|nr:hypothetical protein [Paenibacillus tengchongensis]